MARAKTGKKRTLAPYIILLAVLVLMRVFVFTNIQVSGDSMETALHDGENIILEKVSHVFSDPKRYDIVVCRFPNRNSNYVKRIIALPGETIEIQAQTIHIDGRPLQDDVYGYGRPPESHNNYRMVVPVGHYFVMGDNRQNSMDSVELGPIRKQDILGRGVAVIWPLNKIRLLT